jgi:hypothetical protein
MIRKSASLLHVLAIDLRTVQSQLGASGAPRPSLATREGPIGGNNAATASSSSSGSSSGHNSTTIHSNTLRGGGHPAAVAASTVTVLSLRASVMTALRCLKATHDPPPGSSWEER